MGRHSSGSQSLCCYRSGRGEGMSELDMMEQAVREQIAQDIINEYDGDDRQYWLTDILKRCVEIARGEVKE